MKKITEFQVLKEIIKKEANISEPSARYVFSCLWLLKYHSELDEATFCNLFYDVIEKFYEKKLPSFSFIFLLLDDELKINVLNVLKKYNLTSNFWMDPYNIDKKENIKYKDLLRMLKKGDVIHSLYVIAMDILSSSFSRIEVFHMAGAIIPNMKMLKCDAKQLFEYASISRTNLIGTKGIEDGMGYKLGNSIIEEIRKNSGGAKENVFSDVKNKIILPKNINFSNISLLTGNGFSKYITDEYLNDNWLSSNQNFKNVFKYMHNRINLTITNNKKLLNKTILFNDNEKKIFKKL